MLEVGEGDLQSKCPVSDRAIPGLCTVEIVLDPPTAVTVTIMPAPSKEPFKSSESILWAAEEKKSHSVVELTYDRLTGALQSLRVEAKPGVLFSRLAVTGPEQTIRSMLGIPAMKLIFRKSFAVPSDAVRVKVDLPLHFDLGLDRLRIILSEDEIAHQVITSDRKLRCEFNEDNELTAITLLSLSTTDMLEFGRGHSLFTR